MNTNVHMNMNVGCDAHAGFAGEPPGNYLLLRKISFSSKTVTVSSCLFIQELLGYIRSEKNKALNMLLMLIVTWGVVKV